MSYDGMRFGARARVFEPCKVVFWHVLERIIKEIRFRVQVSGMTCCMMDLYF